ncbi:MAG TPA: hypothetical protein VGS28_00150 [Candidatus Saccharimonadales bacterium]|nr:hypothetical protein [Candidatus Saccharimonadales bacterium]
MGEQYTTAGLEYDTSVRYEHLPTDLVLIGSMARVLGQTVNQVSRTLSYRSGVQRFVLDFERGGKRVCHAWADLRNLMVFMPVAGDSPVQEIDFPLLMGETDAPEEERQRYARDLQRQLLLPRDQYLVPNEPEGLVEAEEERALGNGAVVGEAAVDVVVELKGASIRSGLADEATTAGDDDAEVEPAAADTDPAQPEPEADSDLAGDAQPAAEADAAEDETSAAATTSADPAAGAAPDYGERTPAEVHGYVPGRPAQAQTAAAHVVGTGELRRQQAHRAAQAAVLARALRREHLEMHTSSIISLFHRELSADDIAWAMSRDPGEVDGVVASLNRGKEIPSRLVKEGGADVRLYRGWPLEVILVRLCGLDVYDMSTYFDLSANAIVDILTANTDVVLGEGYRLDDPGGWLKARAELAPPPDGYILASTLESRARYGEYFKGQSLDEMVEFAVENGGVTSRHYERGKRDPHPTKVTWLSPHAAALIRYQDEDMPQIDKHMQYFGWHNRDELLEMINREMVRLGMPVERHLPRTDFDRWLATARSEMGLESSTSKWFRTRDDSKTLPHYSPDVQRAYITYVRTRLREQDDVTARRLAAGLSGGQVSNEEIEDK